MSRERDLPGLGEDLLDLGIQAAFGSEVPMDPSPAPSVLRRLRRDQDVPEIALRDPDEAPTLVARNPSSRSEDSPRHVDRYQIAGEIARGGVGSVLKARDVDLGRTVALKVLLRGHRDDTEITRRFLEEAQIGGQLEHPGIVPVHEIGVLPDERPYFAMKLVKGQTLAALLKSRIDLQEGRQRFLGIFEQLCQTLAYAHSRGVIHRDLKPSNVMVGAFGEVQVMDWGLAKVLANGGATDENRTTRQLTESDSIQTTRSEDCDSASLAGSVMGTPAYMPPEQARGAVDDLDERCDVFGLGAILCEILTGKPPYWGGSLTDVYSRAREGDLSGAMDRLERCRADRELIELARSCLSAEIRGRPRNAVVVAKRIRAHLESLERRTRTLEIRAAKARFKLALAIAVFIVLLLGGGGYLWVEKNRRDQEAKAIAAVNEAIAEAGGLRSQAEARDDLSLYDAALRESTRALDLASEGLGDDILDRARNLHSQIADRVRNRRVVAELAMLREERGTHFEEMERSFGEILSSYGIDVDAVGVGDAARMIRDSEISTDLILALDQWAMLGRRPSRGNRDLREKLLRIAQLADDDPWRRSLRTAIETWNRETLLELTEEAKARKVEPFSLELLALALHRFDERSNEEAVLRRAQALYPDDFWISTCLGRLLLEEAKTDDALCYLTAAVALRPASAYARSLLGSALGEKGELRRAAVEFRRALSLESEQGFSRAFRRCSEFLEAEGIRIPKEDLNGLIGTLEDKLGSGRDYHHLGSGRDYHRDGLYRLLSQALFLKGERDRAVLVIEEALRLGGRPRFSPGFRPRGRSLEVELESYRAAVLPDLVSYASIDAALEKAELPDLEFRDFEDLRLPPVLQGFRDLHRANEERTAAARLAYLEGRLLERAGRHREAAERFDRTIRLDRSLPEPFLHLAECLQVSGDVARAERALRQGLGSDLARYAVFWQEWAEISLRDLGRSPEELLSTIPRSPSGSNPPESADPNPGVCGEDLRWLLERLAAEEPIRINCGGEIYESANGAVWGRDRFFTGGSLRFFGRRYTGDVAGTGDDPVYRTERRFGPWSGSAAGYRIPLAPGRYEVGLCFAETSGPPQRRDRAFRRTFHVRLEAETVLEEYDPAAKGFATADRRTFAVRVEDGALDILFIPGGRGGMGISAIEIRRLE